MNNFIRSMASRISFIDYRLVCYDLQIHNILDLQFIRHKRSNTYYKVILFNRTINLPVKYKAYRFLK